MHERVVYPFVLARSAQCRILQWTLTQSIFFRYLTTRFGINKHYNTILNSIPDIIDNFIYNQIFVQCSFVH